MLALGQLMSSQPLLELLTNSTSHTLRNSGLETAMDAR